MNLNLSIKKIKRIFNDKGYDFFENGDYNLNIIGIRNNNREAGLFDDIMLLIYKKNGKWKIKKWAITTDPGRYYLQNPMNTAGTAILVPDQYKQSFKLRKHRGKYMALCQHKPIAVWRDDNGNNYLDMIDNTIQIGEFGINIHRAGNITKKWIGKYSAGCQVFKNKIYFEIFMFFVKKAAKIWGNSFTYTLLEESDFDE